MKYSSVIYVDPTISVEGDGRTPFTAVRALPACADMPVSVLYVIRRTNVPIILNGGMVSENEYSTSVERNGTTQQLGIWAMPKAGEDRWDMMPIEAQSVWGADEPEYAILKATSKNSMAYSNLKDLSLMGIEILNERDNNGFGMGGPVYVFDSSWSGGHGNDGRDKKHCGNLSIKHCRLWDGTEWGTAGDIPAAKSCCFVRMMAVNDFSLSDSIIYCSPGDGGEIGGQSSSILCGLVARLVSICGNFIYMATRSYSYVGGSDEYGKEKASMTPGAIIVNDDSNANDSRMQEFSAINNVVKVVSVDDGGPSYFIPSAINCRGGYGLYVKVVGFDVSESRSIGSLSRHGFGGSLLKLPRTVMQNHLDNIAVNLPKVAKIGYDPVIWIREEMGSYEESSSCAYLNSIVRGISVIMGSSNDGESNSHEEMWNNEEYYSAVSLNGVIASDISIDAPWSKGLYARNSRVDCIKANGSIYARKSTVTSQECTVMIGEPAVRYWDKCIVTIGKMSVPNASDKDAVVNHSGMDFSNVWIGESDRPIRLSNHGMEPGKDDSYQYGNYDDGSIQVAGNGLPGRFHQYGTYGNVFTWDSIREGSSSIASLKFCSSSSVERKCGLCIGQLPGSIIMADGLSSGKHRATVYLAATENVDVDDMMEVELITDAGIWRSSSDGYLVPDSSKWTGAGIVKGYKYVTQISLSNPGKVHGRLRYSGYGDDRMVFVDPVAVID